jgi:NitT/TauT family transport system permease protein
MVWQVAGMTFGAGWLPPLSAVLVSVAGMAMRGELVGPLSASLASLAIGYPAAVVAGVLVGAALARSEVVRHLFDVYFDALMASPTLIYVPVLFALFGVSRASQVAVVFAYAFFVIAGMTELGIRDTDRRLTDMARAFGASERQVFWSVCLPAAMPAVLTGVRLGAARAVKGMVVGEIVIALTGLGAVLKASGGRFDITGVLSILLVILAVSVSCNTVVRALERHVLGHRAA